MRFVLQPVGGGEKGLGGQAYKNVIQKLPILLLFISHWAKFSYTITPSYKGCWELQSLTGWPYTQLKFRRCNYQMNDTQKNHWRAFNNLIICLSLLLWLPVIFSHPFSHFLTNILSLSPKKTAQSTNQLLQSAQSPGSLGHVHFSALNVHVAFHGPVA